MFAVQLRQIHSTLMETITYQAVPVRTQSKSNSSPSPQPALFIDNAQVQAIGAVDFRSQLTPARRGVPNDITLVFDNSGGASAATYIFGDSNELIAAITGVTYAKPTIPSSSYAAVVASLGKNPVVIKSLNYRITTGNSGQFSNKFQYADADFDGSLDLRPINIQSAQRNTQQNDKILTLAQEIPFDDTTGIILTVAAATVVQIDISFGQIYRPGMD